MAGWRDDEYRKPVVECDDECECEDNDPADDEFEQLDEDELDENECCCDDEDCIECNSRIAWR